MNNGTNNCCEEASSSNLFRWSRVEPGRRLDNSQIGSTDRTRCGNDVRRKDRDVDVADRTNGGTGVDLAGNGTNDDCILLGHRYCTVRRDS